MAPTIGNRFSGHYFSFSFNRFSSRDSFQDRLSLLLGIQPCLVLNTAVFVYSVTISIFTRLGYRRIRTNTEEKK